MLGIAAEDGTLEIGILLIPGFSLMAFASAVEPMRAANRLSAEPLYRWRLLSPDGGPVAASNGIVVVPEDNLQEAAWLPTVMVCAGLDVEGFADKRVFSWLRSCARHGRAIGGLCTGSHILARLGLLDGYRCTIHWENLGGFREAFPAIEATSNLFEIDRDRFSCSGGTAAIDLMLHVIGHRNGHELSAAVSEQFLHRHIRTADEPQRMTLRERLGVRHPKLIDAVAEIERNIEQPVPRQQLAESVGLSVRQLDRLFRLHLGRTLRQFYLDTRLNHARRLLLQTSMPVTEVALASGFSSGSHFSRVFRLRYGHAPRAERGAG